MLYLLFCEDKADSENVRLATREDHLGYVGSQSDRVKLAGPMFSEDGQRMVGSMFIIEADSIETAREFNANDPYTSAGLFGSVIVRPFKQVVPAPGA